MIPKEIKKKADKTWKKRKLLCDEIDLNAATKEQLMYTIRVLEGLLQSQQENIKHFRKTNTFQQKIIKENKKGIATLVDKYEDHTEDLQRQLQDCNAKRAEAVRAYNGLHTLGKFAEEQGIDIKSAGEELPESEKNRYNFSQKHTLLESGRVKHSYSLKTKKNGKGSK